MTTSKAILATTVSTAAQAMTGCMGESVTIFYMAVPAWTVFLAAEALTR
jgi:hypothetical protein